MSTQPNIKLAVPFFMVHNMENSLHFYVEQLGFSVTNQWTPRGKIEWCWLQRDQVALMLQETANNYNCEQRGNGVSIAFQCEDALALYHEFTAKGVDIKEPFVGNNMW